MGEGKKAGNRDLSLTPAGRNNSCLDGDFPPPSLGPPNGPKKPRNKVCPVTTGGFFFSAYPLLALMLRDEWCLEGY